MLTSQSRLQTSVKLTALDLRYKFVKFGAAWEGCQHTMSATGARTCILSKQPLVASALSPGTLSPHDRESTIEHA